MTLLAAVIADGLVVLVRGDVVLASANAALVLDPLPVPRSDLILQFAVQFIIEPGGIDVYDVGVVEGSTRGRAGVLRGTGMGLPEWRASLRVRSSS